MASIASTGLTGYEKNTIYLEKASNELCCLNSVAPESVKNLVTCCGLLNPLYCCLIWNRAMQRTCSRCCIHTCCCIPNMCYDMTQACKNGEGKYTESCFKMPFNCISGVVVELAKFITICVTPFFCGCCLCGGACEAGCLNLCGLEPSQQTQEKVGNSTQCCLQPCLNLILDEGKEIDDRYSKNFHA